MDLNTVVSSPHWLDLEKVCGELQGDSKLVQIITSLEVDPNSYPVYLWQRGLLFYKGRLVLSKSSTVIPDLL